MFYIFPSTFSVLILGNLVSNSSFCPFVAIIYDSNLHISLLGLRKFFPSFAYLTWRVKCFVYNTYFFRLKLTMELTLDHLCLKWIPFRASTLMRQCIVFLEALWNSCQVTFPLTIRLLSTRDFSNHYCNKALLHQTP